MKVLVERAGYLTSIQDLGRRGHRASGVSVGGALDASALRVANLLVGNEPAAAGLEVVLGEVRLRFADERLVAWCGGEFDVETTRGVLPAGHAARVVADEELRIRPGHGGGRAWFAISGGIDVPLVLGSRSTDLRNAFGGFEGRALADGETLSLGAHDRSCVAITKRLGEHAISSWSAPAVWASTTPTHPFLRVVRGADWERFATAALEWFCYEAFTVEPDSDRMGVRLSGPELRRKSDEELISEAVTPGTIQVPPSGQPIVLLGDCQTIGGYPKIAHVITVDLPAAAQLSPGDAVQFAEVSVADAQRLLLQRERDLAWFQLGLSLQSA